VHGKTIWLWSLYKILYIGQLGTHSILFHRLTMTNLGYLVEDTIVYRGEK